MSRIHVLLIVGTLALSVPSRAFASYTCNNPESYQGETVGTGQCVAFVQQCSSAPQTALWSQGVRVRGNDIPPGTAIATFVDGRYPNHAHGNHAAIYVSQDEQGITVWDQWSGQPVHQRVIRFKGDNADGDPSNNGDAFYVIE